MTSPNFMNLRSAGWVGILLLALVTLSLNLVGMVEDILQLQPQTTNIAVVFGASAMETAAMEQ